MVMAKEYFIYEGMYFKTGNENASGIKHIYW